MLRLHHPLQNLPETTLAFLLRWSRLFFWIVLALFAAVRFASMPSGSLTPEVLLRLAKDQPGAFGFWAGFDYLFMVAYTVFFSVCCVWAAGKHRPESIWHKAGIALAWLSLLQLGLDMAENYCFWQFAQGRESESLKSGYLFLEKAKKADFHRIGVVYAGYEYPGAVEGVAEVSLGWWEIQQSGDE
ncbi:MAG: hypothetical protein IPJ82_22265 [Lewinellaceae bacterium]|nr:hypothetical protein [Lewinellaceae bacterium]